MVLPDEPDIAEVERELNTEGPQAVFNDKFIGNKACELIAHRLRKGSHKTDVQLRGNYISCQGAAALADMLKVTSTLQSLSLEWNEIGNYEMAVAALAGALEVNQTLTYLDLRNNHISPDGASMLARSLRANNVLHTLDLRWNDVGDAGAEAFYTALDSNKTLRELRLSGNKVDDCLLSKIDTRIRLNSEKDSPHMMELTRTKERMAEVESELSHITAMRFSETSLSEEMLQTLKDDKDSAVMQLEASTAKVVNLEHDLLLEKGNMAELRAKLEIESSAKSQTEVLLQEARANLNLSQEKEQRLEQTIESLNEERRDLQSKLNEARILTDEQAVSLREENKEKDNLVDQLNQEKARLVQALKQAEASIIQLKAKLGLMAAHLEEETQAMDKIQIETKVQLEDLTHTYEERLRALKTDMDKKVRLAEDRYLEADAERKRLSSSRDTLQRELSKVQLEVEEKLSNQERRLRQELSVQHEAEADELTERIASLQQAREVNETLMQQQATSIEELKSRLSQEYRDHAKALKDLRSELERSKSDAREQEARASKLEVDTSALEQKVTALQQQRLELERDRAKLAETHRENLQAVKDSYEDEKSTMMKDLEAARRRAATLEDRLQKASLSLSSMHQQGIHKINNLEKCIVNYIHQACAEARDRESAKLLAEQEDA